MLILGLVPQRLEETWNVKLKQEDINKRSDIASGQGCMGMRCCLGALMGKGPQLIFVLVVVLCIPGWP